MKATELIQHLIEEISSQGYSDVDGVYSSTSVSIHNSEVDILPSSPVKMSLKDTMKVSNQLRGFPRVCPLEVSLPVISCALKKSGTTLDLYACCGTVDIVGELPHLIASFRHQLEKYSKDLGFTPGTHHYNLIDPRIPWEHVATVDLDQSEEGWI